MPSPYHPPVPAPRDPSPLPPSRADPARPGAAPASTAAPAASTTPSTPTTPKPPTSSTPSDTRDRALVEAVKEGRPGAWNELVRIYQDRIYSLCLRTAGNHELAMDLAQDTMVKLVQHIDRYDGRCQFFTWVYRITLNTCLTKLRSEKLRRTVSLDAIDGNTRPSGSGHIPDRTAQSDFPRGSAGQSRLGRAGSGEPDAAERVEQDEARSAVLRAMQQLAPEHAAVLILRDAHALEYQQIADALEVSVGTVKSRIFRARAALRDLLESPSTPPSTSVNP